MTAKIKNGEYAFDPNGNLLEISGKEEILQRAYFRLMAHKGEFELDKSLGSELYKMNLKNMSDDLIEAHVLETLMDIEEIDVTGLEKSVLENEKLLLTIYLKILNENAILEVLL